MATREAARMPAAAQVRRMKALVRSSPWMMEVLRVERALVARLPGVKWDAKNQAAVHTWYPRRFGLKVEPLASAADGVSTWPETATAVAVRLERRPGDGEPDGRLLVTAAHGLDDLLVGVWRRNPRRVTVAEYRRRLVAKRVSERWPKVVVVDG